MAKTMREAYSSGINTDEMAHFTESMMASAITQLYYDMKLSDEAMDHLVSLTRWDTWVKPDPENTEYCDTTSANIRGIDVTEGIYNPKDSKLRYKIAFYSEDRMYKKEEVDRMISNNGIQTRAELAIDLYEAGEYRTAVSILTEANISPNSREVREALKEAGIKPVALRKILSNK